MRSPLALILSFAIFTAMPALGADALTGIVVSMDRDRGELHLRSDGSGQVVTVRIRDGRLPAFARPGESVTVWGKWGNSGAPLFHGRNLAPGFSRRRPPAPDPTGVRSRLFQGK
jgi:hypothetical protein